MATDIEPKPFVFDRPRKPAHIPRILLDEKNMMPVPGELIAGRQARRPRTDDYNALSELGIQNNLTNRVRLSLHQAPRLGQTIGSRTRKPERPRRALRDKSKPIKSHTHGLRREVRGDEARLGGASVPETPEIDTDKLDENIHEELERAGGSLLKALALSTALFAAF